MLVAGLLFACMGALVKLGAPHFSSAELVFYRSFFGLLIVYALVHHSRIKLTTFHWHAHLWRGLSGTVAMLLFFHCITALPLATAITLNYTSSLFLSLLTVVVLKEKFHFPLSSSLAIGFSGVVLLLQPTLEHKQFADGLLGLASGFLAGIALMNVRHLGVLGEPGMRVVFYFNLIATLASAIWMLGDALHPVTLGDLPLLIAIGASATFAQLFMTRAYRTGQTLVVGSLAYSTIVFSALFGLIFWREQLSLLAWLGIALIIASGVLSLKLSPKIQEKT
ncbi:MAG: DMT family transporter [Gammaproteobacteria bacterium]|nr:DMT family transporter [Gammaproteobacteria bacterium]MBU1446855.1 DMT family transporter [Gammaproteobacteria bacterium]MDD2928839.1 DMT family transporter [Sideroxydans sp.]